MMNLKRRGEEPNKKVEEERLEAEKQNSNGEKNFENMILFHFMI